MDTLNLYLIPTCFLFLHLPNSIVDVSGSKYFNFVSGYVLLVSDSSSFLFFYFLIFVTLWQEVGVVLYSNTYFFQLINIFNILIYVEKNSKLITTYLIIILYYI